MQKIVFYPTAFISVLCLFLSIPSVAVFANQNPKPLATDSRMRVVSYDPNNVVSIVGSQLVQTSIQFGEDETIVGVEGGDSTAWTIAINKNKPNILFVKPTMDNSDTNLAVMTDQNFYQFHLVTGDKDTASNKAVTYNVRFRYPQKIRAALNAKLRAERVQHNAVVTNNRVDPMRVNWNYSFSSRCSRELVPIKAFNDNKFTYFQFAQHTEVPAIFVVDQNGRESLANWQMRGSYVVIRRIARQFSMRNGNVVSCVFNDAYAS